MNRAIAELSEKLKHTRHRLYALTNYVRSISRTRRLTLRRTAPITQLHSSRSNGKSVPGLKSWRQLVRVYLDCMDRYLPIQTDSLELKRKKLMEFRGRADYLHRRKRDRPASIRGDALRKHGMWSHPTWQLNCVSVRLLA